MMRGGTILAVLLGLHAGGAAAQGMDCAKARTPTEKAICAAPGLRELDRQVARAYAEAAAREPGNAVQQAQRAWLRARDAACSLPASAMPACLAAQMTSRIAALTPPPVATPAPTSPAVVARAPSVPVGPEAASASIVPASIPAARQMDALLEVTHAGRFAIAAQSRSGVAIQVVDMLTGPSEIAGAAGERDGRIDMLLDVGTYRVRAFAAEGTDEAVALTATPFRDVAAARAFGAAGETVAGALRDREQQGFWFVTPPSGLVRIEAAGRALADLRLWRNGRELSALTPVARTIEPSPGHGLTDMRLEGLVEPGIYLAMAYGGPASVWSDGSAESPFYARTGVSEALALGWAAGPIGPFGSERYLAPNFAGSFRLALPQAADVQLVVGGSAARISKTSREAWVRLEAAAKSIVEVRGAAGQAFTLQAGEAARVRTVMQPGRYWISAVTQGAGGDEAPPTVVLERAEAGEKARIVAGNLPRLGVGTPWHGRFNLRGPTALLFENPQGGPVTVRTTGLSMRNDPGVVTQYDLPAGYYVLRLAPEAGAAGAVDVVVSVGPGAVAAAAALPADPVIPLGVQELGPKQSLRLSAQSAPGVVSFLSARAAPVALVEGPLMVTQAAGGAAVEVPVQVDAGGSLVVSELGGGPVAAVVEGGSVRLPSPDHARTVVLAWRRNGADVADVPAPPADAAVAMIVPGGKTPFDLAREERRSFGLEVAQGGLFRIETTGRLHTAGRLGTAFVPELLTNEAGGVGENMLLQSFLRAGRYRVEVSALGSAGHLAVVANPAPLASGGTLVPGGSARASMAAGTGVVFPVRIAAEGAYHLDLVGLGTAFTARLEDAEGWPVTAPGDLSTLDVDLRAGAYRLLVSPEAVARQVIARLARVEKPVAIEGHGPHDLPFGVTQAATWREPPGRDDARTPDVWTFALAGPADVTLSVSDGMAAELEGVARTTMQWRGRLEAGAYRVTTSSLGRNDRLDYTIGLTAEQLQPGQVRTVTLPVDPVGSPALVPFTLAESRVVALTSWGSVPVKAVLRRADGSEVARAGPREGDWNVALSQRLPAGAYRFELSAATPAAKGVAVKRDRGAADASDDDAGGGSGRSGDDPDAAAQSVEVRLTLPGAVRVVDAPDAAAGSLVMTQGRSADEMVLALEREGAQGWEVTAIRQGRTPLVAALADGARWRVEAWSLEGASVQAEVRVLDAAAAAGEVALRAVDGMEAAVARVRLTGAGVLAVTGANAVAGWPGHAAEAVEAGQAVVQGAEAWLIGPAGMARVEALGFGEARVVSVPAGGEAALPVQPAEAGRMRVWRAETGLGQPGMRTAGMTPGYAAGSVMATAEGAVALGNADGDGAMRARVALLDLAVQPEAGLGALTLAPLSATAVKVSGAVTVTLTPGTGALAERGSAWADAAALTRSFVAGERVVLVNTTEAALPVAVSGAVLPSLRAGEAFKRFFGAAGSFDLPVEGGGTLAVAGEASLQWIGRDGRVREGRTLEVSGDGHAVVTHAAGAVVVSLAGNGASPWPAVAAQTVALPARVALEGAALAVRFTAETAVLLHASTTAPVLIGVGEATPELFGAGAELHVAVPPGEAVVRVYSPHDGALAGTLALSAEPLRMIDEGVGDAVALAPGEAAAFGFELAQAARVGVGVRAMPDRVSVRLLGAGGAVVGEGVAQLRSLPAGRYVIEARVPADGVASLVRPAVVGITKQGNGPPGDVAESYRQLVAEPVR